MTSRQRFLGIACVGADVLSEGSGPVLSNLVERAGATAVSLGLTVAERAPDGQGSFQPPTDGGASVRLFDRPLFGRRSLWIRGAPAFPPDPRHFADGSYAPAAATDLTHRAGPVTADFLRRAGDSGLRTYIQFSASTPPGLRDEDLPRLPDGSIPELMVRTGSLAAPDVRSFNHGRARDVLDAYPGLTGIRLDYAEAPCYKLTGGFTDFSPHALAWARVHGFDVEAMVADVGRLCRYLHGSMRNEDLTAWAAAGDLRDAFAGMVGGPGRAPGIAQWLDCKAALSTDLITDWRASVTAHGGPQIEVSVNGFAPGFTELTGLDPAAAASVCSSLVPKLYTMHWPQIVRFWAEELLAANPGLDPDLLARALVRLFDLADGDDPVRLADYRYPEPDENHPVPDGPQRRKIDKVLADVAGRVPVYPLVHGYGPVADFRRRLQVVADSAADGVWINRYGYLSDEKLDIVRDVWA